jgi:hypothetical protein
VSLGIRNAVRNRDFGSIIVKAVALAIADRANDDGAGVYASQGTLADDTGATDRSVRRAIRQLLDDGLLRSTGHHQRADGGATVIYALDLAAIKALPLTRSAAERKRRANTPRTQSPGGGRTESPGGVGQPVREAADTESGRGRTQSPPNDPLSYPMNAPATSARAPAASSDDFLDRVLRAAGVDLTRESSTRWFDPKQRWIAGRWLSDLGLTEDEAVAVVADIAKRPSAAKIGSLGYFDTPMQEAAGRKKARPLEPVVPAKPRDAEAARRAAWGIYPAKPTREDELDRYLDRVLAEYPAREPEPETEPEPGPEDDPDGGIPSWFDPADLDDDGPPWLEDDDPLHPESRNPSTPQP